MWNLIASFFSLPERITLWSIVDSQFFTTAVLGVATVYFSRVNQELKEQVEAEKAVNDALVDIEAGAVIEDAAPFGVDEFTATAEIVDRLKRFVDEKVAGIRDGRTLRKYENIGRRDYRVRASVLQQDGKLTDEKAGILIHAFDLWRPYQNHRQPTPVEIHDQIAEIAAQVGAI